MSVPTISQSLRYVGLTRLLNKCRPCLHNWKRRVDISLSTHSSQHTLNLKQNLASTCRWHSTKQTQVQTNSPEATSEPDVLYKTVVVEVTSHDPAVLKSYEFFANEAAKLLDITVASSATPPKIIERTTVLKSRHGHGKYHKVQYERRTHFKVIELKRLTGSTADTYLEYIQRNLPEGCAMKVTRTRLERFPEHIKRPNE